MSMPGDAEPPAPPKLPWVSSKVPPASPPIAVCVRLSVPLVAPPIASFTPPLLIRLTGAPAALTALPPIAVPETVTVPLVAELPKTAGPRPPLDRVAPPPRGLPKTPFPPVAVAEIVTWSRAIPLAWAFALPPVPPKPRPSPPPPPIAVEETEALGTLITIEFEVALPPGPPTPEPVKPMGIPLAPLCRLCQSR